MINGRREDKMWIIGVLSSAHGLVMNSRIQRNLLSANTVSAQYPRP